MWYLLHYCYYVQQITTADLQTKLKKHIPSYDKAKDYFDELLSKREDAIKQANKLNQKHINAGTELLSVKSNPSTQVFILVKEILRVIETNRKKKINAPS